MRLIVIGASGFLGNAIFNAAKEADMDVLGTARQPQKGFIKYDLVKDSPENLLKNLPSCFSEGVPLALIIAAAITKRQDCDDNPKLAYTVNVAAPKRLLSLCAEHSIRTICFSSDAVFDGTPGHAPYCETDRLHPLGRYGEHKQELEKFVLSTVPNGLIFRLPKLIDITPNGNHLLAELYRQYKNRQPVVCIKGLRFQPTYVKDVAACTLLALKQGLHGIYNVAAPRAYSRLDAAKKFFQKHHDIAISELPLSSGNFRSDMPLDLVMNTNKWQQTVNFTFTDFEAICEKFWINAGILMKE